MKLAVGFQRRVVEARTAALDRGRLHRYHLPNTTGGTMAIIKSLAVPIQITDYSETSLIAAFFTRASGLVRAVFKGAYRKDKVYRSNLDLLTPGELTYYERKTGLNILKEFAPAREYRELHGDLERYRCSMACLEFVRHSVMESEPARELFDTFVNALEACATGRQPWTSVYCFLLAGLRLAGFEPALGKCASCGGTRFPSGHRARTAFSHGEGGVLCMDCGKGTKVGIWLSRETLETLRLLREMDAAEAADKELTKAQARELRGFLRQYCEFTFERRFRMLK
jgi:DNA repair protein RecO (recombination protein O)